MNKNDFIRPLDMIIERNDYMLEFDSKLVYDVYVLNEGEDQVFKHDIFLSRVIVRQ